MSKIVVTKVHPNGDEDIDVLCDCGKPLVVANEYGMFCEDRCGERESKQLAKQYKGILDEIEADDALTAVAGLLSSLFDDI